MDTSNASHLQNTEEDEVDGPSPEFEVSTAPVYHINGKSVEDFTKVCVAKKTVLCFVLQMEKFNK